MFALRKNHKKVSSGRRGDQQQALQLALTSGMPSSLSASPFPVPPQAVAMQARVLLRGRGRIWNSACQRQSGAEPRKPSSTGLLPASPRRRAKRAGGIVSRAAQMRWRHRLAQSSQARPSGHEEDDRVAAPLQDLPALGDTDEQKPHVRTILPPSPRPRPRPQARPKPRPRPRPRPRLKASPKPKAARVVGTRSCTSGPRRVAGRSTTACVTAASATGTSTALMASSSALEGKLMLQGFRDSREPNCFLVGVMRDPHALHHAAAGFPGCDVKRAALCQVFHWAIYT